MDKRYQIFISSTYTDLIEERRAVTEAILKRGHIPSGMEMFSAGDVQQWEVIKKAIDQCDYFFVLVGARYGSLGPEGQSYTEMEYHYALKRNIPIAGFVHGNPGKISADLHEETATGKRNLAKFRALVKKKPVEHWQDRSELPFAVAQAIDNLKANHARPGWVRGDAAQAETQPSTENNSIDLNLHGKSVTVQVVNLDFRGDAETYRSEYYLDEILTTLASKLLIRATGQTLKGTLERQTLEEQNAPDRDSFPDLDLTIADASWSKVLFTLKDEGAIEVDTDYRTQSSSEAYWRFTDAGNRYTTKLFTGAQRHPRAIADKNN